MPSSKQLALADLSHWITCLSRGPQTYGVFERILKGRDYQDTLEYLNLIHRIPESILSEEYTDLDISFINEAIPRFLESVLRRRVDPRIAHNMVLVYDCVPPERKHEITFVLPDWLRELSDKESCNKIGSV
jgi:hypothetical protein